MKGLSPRAQRLLVALTQDEGRKSGSVELLPEHVLLALLKSADGLGYILLQHLHVNVLTFQLNLEQSLVPAQKLSTDYSDLPPSRRLRTLLDMAVERDIIHKSGAFFSYQDQRLAQGRDNARIYLKEHPDIADEIDALIRQQLAQTTVPAVNEDDIPEMDVDADMTENDEE